MNKLDVCDHRRGRYDIIISILETAKKDAATRTKIASKGNLSTAQADKYLDELEKRKFLARHGMSMKKAVVWKTTETGLLVIEACKICHSLAEKSI